MFGSSIYPRLSEVSGADKSIAGSKHNTLYHFKQRSRKFHKHQSTKGHEQQKWHIPEAHAE
ncbi:hypothetical protein B296_00033884 [Ensete ventricosum]|uniref:Uncharacterized protein n=1 Tax=Ensete ventricosum TaxID=4639 RepID=A0A426YG15_ENSVE|nr:hypothetical protein B296_00033884 [Ensete ventricosum]